jgi:type IV secretion system protein TrbG
MRKLPTFNHSHLCAVGAAALLLTRPFVSVAQDAAPAPENPSPTPEAAQVAVVQKSAQEGPVVLPEALAPAPPNLGGKDPALNYQEAAGVQITAAWQAKSAQAMVAQPGPDGSVQFKYGQCLPQVVCGLLQFTDIELQPGETVSEHDVHVGDPKRWVLESSLSGEGDGQIQHLFVQPLKIGIYTTLDVTTSRRTYRLFLVADSTRFMHHVSFVYEGKDAAPAKVIPVSAPPKDPETPRQRDDAGEVRVAQAVAKERPVAGRAPAKRTKVLLMAEGKGAPNWTAKEDDGYRIVGKAPWRPIRVYTEDGKTFLEMPKGIGHTEAPVLYLLRKSGWFHTSKDVCPYRIHGRWYIADVVIDRALLVVGVGSSQQKVEVVRTAKEGGEL